MDHLSLQQLKGLCIVVDDADVAVVAAIFAATAAAAALVARRSVTLSSSPSCFARSFVWLRFAVNGKKRTATTQ